MPKIVTILTIFDMQTNHAVCTMDYRKYGCKLRTILGHITNHTTLAYDVHDFSELSVTGMGRKSIIRKAIEATMAKNFKDYKNGL